MWSFSLLCFMLRPHRASSGQLHDNRAVFRNGEQPFGSTSPERVSAPTVGFSQGPQGASRTGWCSAGCKTGPGTARPSARIPLAAAWPGLRAPAPACSTLQHWGKGVPRAGSFRSSGSDSKMPPDAGL